MSEIQTSNLQDELWREYEFGGKVYRIEHPHTLYLRPGGTTHRVWDGDVAHCIPAPGVNGCVLRWKPRDASHPVAF